MKTSFILRSLQNRLKNRIISKILEILKGRKIDYKGELTISEPEVKYIKEELYLSELNPNFVKLDEKKFKYSQLTIEDLLKILEEIEILKKPSENQKKLLITAKKLEFEIFLFKGKSQKNAQLAIEIHPEIEETLNLEVEYFRELTDNKQKLIIYCN